jgi:nucleoside-diphosphate-sugar epimerase
VHVARVAKQAGVRQFLFSSSCSVYGKVSGAADEQAELNPLSAYAKSKIDSERELAELASPTFSPVYLRNSTAFGHSANLRIDLVANNLLASAIAVGEIRVMTDGTPWRPLVHCADIARAFVAIATTPPEHTHNLAINIGADDLNVQVRDVADVVKALVPDAPLHYAATAVPDPRDYRVSFARFRSILPHFSLRYGLESGLRELHERYLSHGFSRGDFDGPRFVRLRTLRKHLPAA